MSQTGAQKIPAKPAGSDPFIILEAQEQRSGVCPGHCGFRILSPARLRLLRRPAGLGRVSAEGAGPCASPIASPSRRIGACGGRRGRRVSGEAGRWREGGGTEGRLRTRFAAKSPVFKNDIFGRNHYSPHCHSEGTNRLRLVFRWPERVIRRQSARLGRLRRRLVGVTVAMSFRRRHCRRFIVVAAIVVASLASSWPRRRRGLVSVVASSASSRRRRFVVAVVGIGRCRCRRLASSRLASSRFVSSLVVPPRLDSPRLVSPRLVSSHRQASSRHGSSRHASSRLSSRLAPSRLFPSLSSSLARLASSLVVSACLASSRFTSFRLI